VFVTVGVLAMMSHRSVCLDRELSRESTFLIQRWRITWRHVTRIMAKLEGLVGLVWGRLTSPRVAPTLRDGPPGPTLLYFFHLAYTCIEILHGPVELVIG
jgi:hypothetical protein